MSGAVLTWIAGPVLRARSDGPFRINEAVAVGPRRLLGEVIRLQDEEIVVQVYEDTSGLRPGDGVSGSGLPLAVPLGPALLGNIFDGLLRPLGGAKSAYIQPGIFARPATVFPFEPAVSVGQRLTPGQAFGRVTPAKGRAQQCLIPPDRQGRVLSIAAAGDYADDDGAHVMSVLDYGRVFGS